MSDDPMIWSSTFQPPIQIAGRARTVLYGVYFPTTDLCVNEMGGRGTGKPTDVEWLVPTDSTVWDAKEKAAK